MEDQILEAFLVIAGKEGEWFIFTLVDPVEWTSLKYYHQN